MTRTADTGAGALFFTGRLTVERARELQGAFQDALARADTLTVDVRGATEIDITFFQLLFAAHRDAKAAGKTLTLSPDHPPVMRAALRSAGLCEHAGLCSQSAEPCLWIGGGEP